MTDAIIEAAARALRETENELGVWDSDDELRQFATAVLTAVTPLIRAQVLEEAAKAMDADRAWRIAALENITLERAAKEAEVFSRHENWEVMSVVRKVAAAIRALKEQP